MDRMPTTSCALLAALAMLGAPAHAKYLPTPLLDLVASAEVIVLGRVTSLDATWATFEVEQPVVGAVPTRITVRRFRDWPCASRRLPYAFGQRVLLFLAHQEQDDGSPDRYRILGAGDEGEVLVVGEEAIVIHGPGIPGLEPRGVGIRFGSGGVGDRGIPLETLLRIIRERRPRRAERMHALFAAHRQAGTVLSRSTADEFVRRGWGGHYWRLVTTPYGLRLLQ